jgi:TRAP-type C4-dicarboxylate transport system permease small subunit
MADEKVQDHTFLKLWQAYTRVLRLTVMVFAFLAGGGVLVMIGVTCADVLLRRFSHPIIGAYDIVKIGGALTLAFGLPYTTAVKGHVAIEYFFHKLGRKSRIIVDSFLRLLAMSFFAFLAFRSVNYGVELYEAGLCSQTLEVPLFWVSYVIASCCVLVMLVIGFNLVHPGREMIKP